MNDKRPPVTMSNLQYVLGVRWPPARRFVVRYGCEDQIQGDPETGETVPANTADKVVRAFIEETSVGMRRDYGKYPRLEMSSPFVPPAFHYTGPEEKN